MSCPNFSLTSQPNFDLSGCSRSDNVSHVTHVQGAELNMSLQYLELKSAVIRSAGLATRKSNEEYEIQEERLLVENPQASYLQSTRKLPAQVVDDWQSIAV
jgi:hypothetical protein